MGTAVRAILSFILAFFGALVGWNVAQHTRDFYQGLNDPMNLLNSLALVCLGILLGLAVAPFATRLLLGLITFITGRLERLSLQQILLGAVGLIFGLIIAFFSSLLMSNLPVQRVPLVGEYLVPLIIVINTLFWSVLGTFFGIRVAAMHTLSNVITPPSTLISLAQPGQPKLLDTSVVIDGRIGEIVGAGFVEGAILVPQFVLGELQKIADSGDAMKRARGKRGLALLQALQKDHGIQIVDRDVPEATGVDAKLVRLALEGGLALVTTDYNLNRVASLQGVKVLNINELANAVKVVVVPGEQLSVNLIKEGREQGQGVGYLADGTMIVVEDARRHVGSTVTVEVTSMLQTHAGKMIFGRLRAAERKSS